MSHGFRRVVPCALVLLMGLACRHPGAAPPDRRGAVRPLSGIDEIIDRFRARIPTLMEQEDLSALSLALVGREGPLWIQGFGSLDPEHRVPVDENTVFSLQSTSKTITTTAILTAVRDGLVDLDTPISTYLPDFTVQSRFEKEPERIMTLRHLLGHRAGFTHEAPVGNNYEPSFPSFDAHVQSIQRTWLRYPVGLHHAYSNLGVDLAGYVLGRISGKGFPRFVQESVLAPLGMTRSSYDWETIRNMRNRATGHWKLVENLPLEFAMIPSGGLYSSAKDMSSFLMFQLNDGRVDGKTLLDGSLLAEMRSPSFAAPGQALGYGLGLRRYQRYGRFEYEHSGAGFGFKSHMSWYPDLGVGIVVLTNSMDQNLVHSIAREIIDAVAESSGLETVRPRYFQDLVPREIPAREVTPILGTYLGRGSQTIEVSRQRGTLEVTFEGETLPLFLVSGTEGYVEWEGGKREAFRFALDESGTPTYVLRVLYGWHYDYDHGPDGPPPGPDSASWNDLVGKYEIRLAGTPLEVGEVRRENGYLFFDQHRLVVEQEPGLFFDVSGEALDLRGGSPTWRNIPLDRLEPQARLEEISCSDPS